MDASSLLDLENEQENKLREQLLIDVMIFISICHSIHHKYGLNVSDN